MRRELQVGVSSTTFDGDFQHCFTFSMVPDWVLCCAAAKYAGDVLVGSAGSFSKPHTDGPLWFDSALGCLRGWKLVVWVPPGHPGAAWAEKWRDIMVKGMLVDMVKEACKAGGEFVVLAAGECLARLIQPYRNLVNVRHAGKATIRLSRPSSMLSFKGELCVVKIGWHHAAWNLEASISVNISHCADYDSLALGLKTTAERYVRPISPVFASGLFDLAEQVVAHLERQEFTTAKQQAKVFQEVVPNVMAMLSWMQAQVCMMKGVQWKPDCEPLRKRALHAVDRAPEKIRKAVEMQE